MAQTFAWNGNYFLEAVMARPKLTSRIAPARKRIMEAFWKFYTTEPIDKITVTQITSAAKINRATFYYYFTSVDDVLEQLENELIPTEIPGIALQAFKNRNLNTVITRFAALNTKRIERICVLASKNGDPLFARRMKDMMIDAWLQQIGGSLPDEIADQGRLYFEFVAAGLLGIIGYHGDRGITPDFKVLIPMMHDHILKSLPDELLALV
jgi:AcrR family transcriptional regulator